MRFLDLKSRIEKEIFGILDVAKLFPNERATAIRTQLYRLAQKGLITSIKRGLYCFDKSGVDEFILAGQLYSPSYISLETALNYHGVIPDIPIMVTSVTPTTTKKIETSLGNYNYLKIDSKLFFGYSQTPFNIAFKEKALLDYFYLRRIRKASLEMRLRLDGWDWKRYHEYAAVFPQWVQKIKLL